MSSSKSSRVDELIEEASASKPDLVGLRTHFSAMERAEISRLKLVIREQEEEVSALQLELEKHRFLEPVRSHSPAKQQSVSRGKKRRAFQLHLSDTHSWEIVTLGSTSGRNEHTPEIGQERLSQIISGAIREIKQESRGADATHLTVWGGGDWMVNADLHYKMERSVDIEPLVEMEQVYLMLHAQLGRIFSEGICQSVSFVGSFSNHGRDSEKMLPGIEASRSYDTAIYTRLGRDFPSVEFIVAETNWTVEDVGGFRTMFTHGHAKKSNVGRTAAGVMVPNWRFVSEMRLDHRLNSWAQGHHHSQSVLWANRFCHVQNGSLVGENPYSNSEGYPPEPPSQNLVVVDLDRCVVEKVVTLFPSI